MTRLNPTRRPPSRNLQQALGSVLLAFALSGPAIHAQANKPGPRPAAPLGNRAAQPQQHPSSGERGTNRPAAADQPHLSQWLESHRNQPLPQQQSALESEPGFHQLKPEEQQRMRNQLNRLNSMPPEQRERTVARTEWMAHLQPQQRQQVRGAMAQLGALPPDRAHALGRTFRQLQSLPEPQRQAYLNSPQAHADFNDGERATLNNLLNVAPLIPPAPPR